MLSGNPTSPVITTSDQDLVTLVVGGMSFTGWAGLTLTQNVDTCADAFALSAPFDPSRADLLKALKPWTICYIYIGQDLILTGYLEKFDTHHDGQSRKITVEGRSKTGQLVDCIVPGASGRQFTGMTLQQIAAQLCQPFGITVGGQYDTRAVSPIMDTDETIFKFLDRVAQGVGLDGIPIPGVTQAIAKLTSDGLGRLVIQPPYPSGSPVASLIEGKGPYISGDSSYDATRRFSQYEIYPEANQTIPIGHATDPAVTAYRPTGKKTGDLFSDAKLLAAYERGIAYLSSLSVSIGVSGWRIPKTPAEDPPTGPVWLKDTLITVQAPSIRIPVEAQFMIAGATMTLNEEGRKTTLRITPPGSYVGQLPKVEPWQ